MSDGIIVRSDVAPDGTYVVAIEAGPDDAWVLDRPHVHAHGIAVVEAAARAEYDAAVLDQLIGLGIEQDAAGQMVSDMRAERPPLDTAATAPLELVPGVARRDGRGFLALMLHGKQIGQWEPADARSHAMACFEVTAAVDLDAIYRKTLVGIVGLDDPTARAVVGELAEHRPDDS